MKNRHSILLFIIVNSAIIYCLFFWADNYYLKLYKEYLTKDVVIFKYVDLDGDGINEEVFVKDYDNIYSVFSFRSNDQHISDLKIEGKIKSQNAVSFYDMDRDGLKEMWCITRYRDTLWLNYSDIYSKKVSYAITPVDSNYSLENYDYLVEIAGIYNELLIFSINAGYPLKPRAVYSFNWKTLELKRTKYEGSLLLNPYFFDLDKDGTPEIITRSFAPENIHYKVPYTDSSSWLRILDLQLNHIFKPIEYPHGSSKITVLPVVTDSSNYLAVSSRFGVIKGIKPSVSLINKFGKIVVENESDQSKRLFQSGKKLYSYNEITGEIYGVNSKLEDDNFIMKTEVPLNPHALGRNKARSGNIWLASAEGNNLVVISKDLQFEISYQLEDQILGHPICNGSSVAAMTSEKILIFHLERKKELAKWILLLLIFLFEIALFVVISKARVKKTKIDFLILRSGKERIKVRFNEIFFLESAGEGPYTNVHLSYDEKPLLLIKNIGAIEKELPDQFIRISRSTIVRQDLIKAVKKGENIIVLSIDNREVRLKVSRNRIGNLPF